METLQEFIDGFVMAKRPSFVKKNKPSWITDINLSNMYTATVGPWESPDPVECWALYKLASLTKGNILEIGSWRGRSACFLAQGIKDSGGASTRKLICLDWFKGDSTGGNDPSKEIMIESLNKFKVADLVTIFDHDMLKFDFKSNINDIDLVFYDADHRTRPTATVLKNIHSLINDKCIVAVHDASWGMSVKAIKEVSAEYTHIKTLPVWEGFALLIKK